VTARRAPAGLGAAGRALWRAVLADYQDLDALDRARLAQACTVTDRLAELAVIVADEGALIPYGDTGSRVHPAVVETRQQQIILARLLATLNIEDDDQDQGKREPRRVGVRGVYQLRAVRD
jgi:hypothetical protein